MTPAILLMGPTASGKSALALMLAERFDGEIVTVDSAQVYRGMDIGTAKPDARTRARRPHHLLDVVDPTDAYSAARFAHDAIAAIDAIRARGRVPIVAGGTMLYFKALTEGLSTLPKADAAVRARIDAMARERGWPAMHEELHRVDAATAGRLEPTDAQRIQRALEVYIATGAPLSVLQGHRQAVPLGARLSIALVPPDRSRLHEAIAERFDAMLAHGLVAELAALRERHALAPSLPSMRAVGYRQAWQHLDGEIDAMELRRSGVAATRQLAKRQLTWLRATNALVFDPFDAATPDGVVRAVEARLHAPGDTR
jgi:tRNA dimethylallyltransferase